MGGAIARQPPAPCQLHIPPGVHPSRVNPRAKYGVTHAHPLWATATLAMVPAILAVCGVSECYLVRVTRPTGGVKSRSVCAATKTPVPLNGLSVKMTPLFLGFGCSRKASYTHTVLWACFSVRVEKNKLVRSGAYAESPPGKCEIHTHIKTTPH